MRLSHSFSKKVEDGIKQYRDNRFVETGKRPFRVTAIEELIRKALQGVEPPRPMSEQIDELRTRIERLEATNGL